MAASLGGGLLEAGAENSLLCLPSAPARVLLTADLARRAFEGGETALVVIMVSTQARAMEHYKAVREELGEQHECLCLKEPSDCEARVHQLHGQSCRSQALRWELRKEFQQKLQGKAVIVLTGQIFYDLLRFAVLQLSGVSALVMDEAEWAESPLHVYGKMMEHFYAREENSPRLVALVAKMHLEERQTAEQRLGELQRALRCRLAYAGEADSRPYTIRPECYDETIPQSFKEALAPLTRRLRLELQDVAESCGMWGVQRHLDALLREEDVPGSAERDALLAVLEHVNCELRPGSSDKLGVLLRLLEEHQKGGGCALVLACRRSCATLVCSCLHEMSARLKPKALMRARGVEDLEEARAALRDGSCNVLVATEETQRAALGPFTLIVQFDVMKALRQGLPWFAWRNESAANVALVRRNDEGHVLRLQSICRLEGSMRSLMAELGQQPREVVIAPRAPATAGDLFAQGLLVTGRGAALHLCDALAFLLGEVYRDREDDASPLTVDQVSILAKKKRHYYQIQPWHLSQPSVCVSKTVHICVPCSDADCICSEQHESMDKAKQAACLCAAKQMLDAGWLDQNLEVPGRSLLRRRGHLVARRSKKEAKRDYEICLAGASCLQPRADSAEPTRAYQAHTLGGEALGRGAGLCLLLAERGEPACVTLFPPDAAWPVELQVQPASAWAVPLTQAQVDLLKSWFRGMCEVLGLGKNFPASDPCCFLVAPCVGGGAGSTEVDWRKVEEGIGFAQQFQGRAMSTTLQQALERGSLASAVRSGEQIIVHRGKTLTYFYAFLQELVTTLADPVAVPSGVDLDGVHTWMDVAKKRHPHLAFNGTEQLVEAIVIPHRCREVAIRPSESQESWRRKWTEEKDTVLRPLGKLRREADIETLVPSAVFVVPVSQRMARLLVWLPSILWHLDFQWAAEEFFRGLEADTKVHVAKEVGTRALTLEAGSRAANLEQLEKFGDKVLKYLSGASLLVAFPKYNEDLLSHSRDLLVRNDPALLGYAARLFAQRGWPVRIEAFQRTMPWRRYKKDAQRAPVSVNRKTGADIMEALLAAAYLSARQGGGKAAIRTAEAFASKVFAVQGVTLAHKDEDELWSQLEQKLVALEGGFTWRLSWPAPLAHAPPSQEPKLLEKILGHQFRDPQLMQQCCTHKSEKRAATENNKRLEFLGDAALDLIIAERLFDASDAWGRPLSVGDMERVHSTFCSNQFMGRRLLRRCARVGELDNAHKILKAEPKLTQGLRDDVENFTKEVKGQQRDVLEEVLEDCQWAINCAHKDDHQGHLRKCWADLFEAGAGAILTDLCGDLSALAEKVSEDFGLTDFPVLVREVVNLLNTPAVVRIQRWWRKYGGRR